MIVFFIKVIIIIMVIDINKAIVQIVCKNNYHKMELSHSIKCPLCPNFLQKNSCHQILNGIIIIVIIIITAIIINKETLIMIIVFLKEPVLMPPSCPYNSQGELCSKQPVDTSKSFSIQHLKHDFYQYIIILRIVFIFC